MSNTHAMSTATPSETSCFSEDPVAIFLGASGNSIAANMALKLASQSRYPQIHIISRTKESTAPVIERLRALNPEGVYQSHACDVSLLANVKELGQRLTQQIPKLNLLVLSCGILSVQGRTETSEGHDKKMMLHYYARMGLLDQLLPKLNTATASGQPASVMSILDSTRSYPAGLNLKDLGLTNSYSLKSAADHCTGMTDVYLDHLSKTHPSLTLMHAYPGLVGSDLFRGIPFGSLVKFAFKPITTNTEVCAEYLLEPLTSTTRKAGVFSVGAKGQELARPSISTEVSKAVVEHTDRVLGH